MDSILQTMFCPTPTHDLTSQDGFMSSLIHSRYCVSRSEQTAASVEAKGRCHGNEGAADASVSLLVDAGKFLAERNLIGQFKVSDFTVYAYNVFVLLQEEMDFHQTSEQ